MSTFAGFRTTESPECKLPRSRPIPLRSVPNAFPGGVFLQRKPACPCGGGCPRCRAATDIRIGAPDDPYEREAEAVADRVMDMRDSEVRPAPAGPVIQRKFPASGAAGEEGIPLTKAEFPPSGAATESAPDLVREVLDTPGEPLEPASRAFFEPRFGYDFGAVRVHADGKAGESARALRASAYTAGSHVVFGQERHSPSTPAGKRLLAHELSHVVQQSSGGRKIQRQGVEDAPNPGGSAGPPRLLPGSFRPSLTQPVFSLCPGEPDWSKITPAFRLHGLPLSDRDAGAARENWQTSCRFLLRLGLDGDKAGSLASLGLGFAYNDALSREAPTPVERLERDVETFGAVSAQAAGQEYHPLPRSFFVSPFPGFGEGERYSFDLLLGGTPDPSYLQIVGGLGFSGRF